MTSRRNPFEDLERLFDQMGKQFEDLPAWEGLDYPMSSQLKVDVVEHDDEFEVTADLPGFAKEDIDVELVDDRLRIEAEHEEEIEEGEPGRYVRRERSKQSMSRTITLPEEVDEENVEAHFRNGVLSVTLQKLVGSEEAHRIDIE